MTTFSTLDLHEIQLALAEIVGREQLSTAAAAREAHSQDASSHAAHLPDIVVFPASTEEVSQIARLAHDRHLPLVGWGAGSSIEGNPIPVRGGIVVDFARMNQVLAYHKSDFQVTVQAGVRYKDLNAELAADRLFFAPNPGANASVGGMIANNAAGFRTVKFGATRDKVLALEVVLATGEIVRTGSRSVKQSAGYDLTHLFTGSEGTLGLITAATLQLDPLPQHFSAVTVAFPDVEQAAQAVFEIIAAGLDPAALEMLDSRTVAQVNAKEGFDLPETPNLFLEFFGASPLSLAEELKLVEQICTTAGALRFNAGVGEEARDRLWAARHNVFYTLTEAHLEQTWLVTDVAVPISAYPQLVARTTEALDAVGLDGYLVGHAGDGNLHTIIFFDAADNAAQQRVERFNDTVVSAALALGGTSTGEHGVGLGKSKYMVHEHGETAVELMRQIKQLLDPHGILNPGKVL